MRSIDKSRRGWQTHIPAHTLALDSDWMKFVPLTYIRRLIYLARATTKRGLRASHVYTLHPFREICGEIRRAALVHGINRRERQRTCYSSPQSRLLISAGIYKAFKGAIRGRWHTWKEQSSIYGRARLMRELYQVVNLRIVLCLIPRASYCYQLFYN